MLVIWARSKSSRLLQDTPVEVCMTFLFLYSLSLAATSGTLSYLVNCVSGRNDSGPRFCAGHDQLALSHLISLKCLVLAVNTVCEGKAASFLQIVLVKFLECTPSKLSFFLTKLKTKRGEKKRATEGIPEKL